MTYRTLYPERQEVHCKRCRCWLRVKIGSSRVACDDRLHDTERSNLPMRNQCSIPLCIRPHYARSWCKFHWERWWRYGNAEHEPRAAEKRFLDKVLVTEGCHFWMGALVEGYGQFWADGRLALAHRWAYERWRGPLPPYGRPTKEQIDHLCRNRSCVNPFHLEIVSPRTNTLRGNGVTARRAAQTHCINGHALSGRNLYRVPKTGWRQCRTCKRLRERVKT